MVEQVRQLVQRIFADLQLPSAIGCEETILIRNGFYCGRRFAVDGAHAVWFCEENQIKVYGPEGKVLKVVQAVDRQLAPATSPLADVA